MTPADYAKIKQVFAQAVEVPVEQRTAFLRKKCGKDDETLREVLSLLRHHQDETVIEKPMPRVTRSVSESILIEPPSRVDPYLVLSDVWEENRQILRRRLVIIATVMAVLIATSTVRLFTYQHAAWGYGVRVVGCVISALCAWILHRTRDVTFFQLRIAECVVMLNVGLLLVVIDLRLMPELARDGDEATLISVNNWQYFAWTLIIFIYGVFMPNTWQRAAAVLIPVATIPSLVTALASWIEPQVDVLLDEDKFGQPMPTPYVAACVAIYAAHTIHGARVTAFKARRLAQYKIKRLIGQGGMGQVYEAEHLLLKRACAVKLIQPERSADDRALRRFEREVRATAKLTHPHTIEVYDYGQTKDGVFFFAMELLPGMNLRELVKTAGPLPPPRAVHFLIQACQALTEAHDVGMIHRDIKPANIFASQRGGIYDFTKLLDFGVVREIRVDAKLSLSANMVAGTPSFMSPEQAARPDQIDSRTDIYSLGAVAFFLLTGRPPFVGKTPMQVMLAQVNQPPEVPSTYQPGIPSDVESVVMQCLAKEVSERISSAAELRAELEQCECAGKWSQADAVAWWREFALQTARSLEPAADTIVTPRA